MSLELKVTLVVTFFLVSVFATDESTLTVEQQQQQQQQTETLLRERRDGYGGYGGSGGGYGNSYGGYGCSCPYVHCDNQSNGLLAFGVGALLGLLLALLRNLMTMAAMAPAPAPAPAGRFDNSETVLDDAKIFVDYANNVSWAEGHTARAARKSTLLDMLHLPPNLSNDLGPVLADVMRIYTEGGKKPECMKRWVCEATRDAVKLSGFSSRLASLSSLAIGWYTNDITPILQTIFPEGRQIECEHLSPKCETSLRF